MRLVSLQKGGDLRAAFDRFSRAMAAIENSLVQKSAAFARSDRLGYLCACPANIGTGLHASVLLSLPLLAAHNGFQAVCHQMGLQARRGIPSIAPHRQVLDVSNIERLGISEADVVQKVIVGCSQLVAMELALERGDPLPPVLTLAHNG